MNTGKYFPRIVTELRWDGKLRSCRAGRDSATGTDSSSGAGTPFANENLQQLPLYRHRSARHGQHRRHRQQRHPVLHQHGQLNSGLGYGYTVFGQLLTGTSTLGQMADPVMPTLTERHSQPVNPLDHHLSDHVDRTNPNGTLLIDTTQAMAGRDLDDHRHRA